MPDPLDPEQPEPVTARMTSSGGMWQPPSIEEAAGLFPHYEILGLLGRGGMGAVYQARQLALDRLVAIKLLPLEVSADRDFADRFVREARTMGRLNHPNIISVYDFGQTPAGHLYFAMEFVAGMNLHQIIHGPGVAPVQAFEILSAVCDALDYAHTKGVIHRDIKPANVMVNTDGRVKVADFGLARLTDPGAAELGHTMTGTVMGTPDYMAPEQMRGMNVDHRADVYSLGVMFYEMLCREVPRGIFDPPSTRVRVDARVDQVVTRAMQQAPERRYQNTAEIKADIERIRTAPLVQPRVVAARPAPVVAPAGKKWMALAAGALVLAGGAVFLVPRGKSPRVASKATPAPKPRTPPSFVNTLGMKFVPVPIIGGPTDGKRVLFSVWETRVRDYEVFAKETQRPWPGTDVERGPEYPAVNVTWDDATAFCAWLTEREQKLGKLSASGRYRLPSDHEWSCAVGVGEREDAAKLPGDKDGAITEAFPWGTQWPPPGKAGNYWSEELRPLLAAGKYSAVAEELPGYRDGFPTTAPVGSFAADRFRLHDVGGNVWEWCEDWNDASRRHRVLRGGSWANADRERLLSSNRTRGLSNAVQNYIGFRCVIEAPAPRSTTDGGPWVDGLAEWFAVPAKGPPILVKVPQGARVGERKPAVFTGEKRDLAVRATVRDSSTAFLITLRQRGTVAEGQQSYAALFRRDGTSLIRKAIPLQPNKDLREFSAPPGFTPKASHTFEFKALGDELIVSVDGQQVGSAIDDEYADGVTSILGDSGAFIEKLESLDLGFNP